MSKSYVGMENFICPICGKQHAYGAGILMHTQLKEVFDSAPVVTGYRLCEEHQAMMDSGEVVFMLESSTPNLEGLTGRSIKMPISIVDGIFSSEYAEGLKARKMGLIHPSAFESLIGNAP